MFFLGREPGDRFGVELGKLGIESVRHWEIGKVKAEAEESEKV
jgi:hypothetical protein